MTDENKLSPESSVPKQIEIATDPYLAVMLQTQLPAQYRIPDLTPGNEGGQIVRKVKPLPTHIDARGELPMPGTFNIAVIGSRNLGDGIQQEFNNIAYNLSARLAQLGTNVVSGAAKDIDTAAHWGALSVEGAKTVAVLAQSVHNELGNKRLSKAILSGGGVLLSEYPRGTVIKKVNFVERNRNIIALSHAVVVVAGTEAGGTHQAALIAHGANKPIWVVNYGDSKTYLQKSLAANAHNLPNVRLINDPADLEGLLAALY